MLQIQNAILDLIIKIFFSFNDLKCTSKCLVAYTSQYYFFHHQRDDFDERSEEKHGSVRKEISKKMTNAPIHTVTSFFNDWSKSVCVIFYYPSFFIRFALEMHQRNHTSRFVILHLERISSQSKKINEQIKFDCLAQWDIVKNYFITHKSTKSKFQTVIIIFVTLDTKLIDQCHKFYCSSGK